MLHQRLQIDGGRLGRCGAATHMACDMMQSRLCVGEADHVMKRGKCDLDLDEKR